MNLFTYHISFNRSGCQIQAGCLMQAGGLNAFVPVEAGSAIQAVSLIEGLFNFKYHRVNGVGYRTVVCCVIRDVFPYVLVLDYGIRCSKKRKSYIIKLEAGEPGGSNRSRVSDTSWVSDRSR